MKKPIFDKIRVEAAYASAWKSYALTESFDEAFDAALEKLGDDSRAARRYCMRLVYTVVIDMEQDREWMNRRLAGHALFRAGEYIQSRYPALLIPGDNLDADILAAIDAGVEDMPDFLPPEDETDPLDPDEDDDDLPTLA